MELRFIHAIAINSAAGLLLLTACGKSQETFKLVQRSDDPVELTNLDLNPNGYSGDVTTFVAGVYRNGKPFGHMMGTITAVGSTGKGSRPDREERLLTAVYDLPGGQISALGISYYLKGDKLLPQGESMTRAIVGGTGQYMGVDGEVTTTRNRDNSYTHIMRIVK